MIPEEGWISYDGDLWVIMAAEWMGPTHIWIGGILQVILIAKTDHFIDAAVQTVGMLW